ncbi:MAG: hypothetical protein E3J23_02070 [Candidatus Stahlbacteria bacterium]|nr:MAG: hypothetical protein E3J23_02070 [Candidatus Stahlbacteria bacterium]
MLLLLFIGTVLNFYTNEVVIKRADSTLIPYLGMEIMDNDTITVKDSSKAEILYSDSSTLFIDQNSTITIATSSKKRSVFLSLGRIWAKVKGLLKGESFEINNPISVSGIRGTEFIVSYKDDESEVKVLEGKVNIRELITGKEAILERERMARIKRGMAIEIMKFKLEDIERWNKWKESHLMFLIKKIEKALERGNILQASLLIDQGYVLARRLRLMEEYRSKIEKLKSEYELIRQKQGMFISKIQDLKYSLRKINPIIQKTEPLLVDLKGLVDHLLLKDRELKEYLKENKKQEAIQMLPSINFLMNQIESKINKIPKGVLSNAVIEIERDYNIVIEMESQIPLESDIRDKIINTSRNVKEVLDKVRKLKHLFDKTITDYNNLKNDISQLKHKL